MASSSLGDHAVDPITRLHFLCSQRNLEVVFQDCRVLSTLPVNCNACVTVNGSTLKGRGKTIEAAKQDAANQMIAHLEGKIVNLSLKRYKDINWNSPKMKHPCDRLQVFCGKIGILFKFSDCRSVSLVPPKSSATATVLDVTVTAEASNKQEAKKIVATELLRRLGWDKRVDQHSLESKKSTELVKSDNLENSNPEWTSVQKQLKDLCSEKKLTFKYHDCQQYSCQPPKFNACLTVNDVTIARKGNTEWMAQNRAALSMIDYLNGKPVDFGYSTRRGYTIMSNVLSQKEKSNPVCQLIYLCKQKGIDFQFKPGNLPKGSDCRYSSSATILGVTIADKGTTMDDANRKVAVEMLAKLGWDEEKSETGNMVHEAKVVKCLNSTQENSLAEKSVSSSYFDKVIKLEENPDKTLSSDQQQLEDVCSARNLAFKYHDCQQYSTHVPKFNACLTVNDVTIARNGTSLDVAKNNAVLAMIDYLNGKPVDFGYPTRKGYTLYSKVVSEKEKFIPTCRLTYLCKEKGIEFEFKLKNLQRKGNLSVHKYSSTTTVLGFTAAAEGDNWIEINAMVAAEILAKLGWDQTDSVVSNTPNIKLDDSFEKTVDPDEELSFTGEPDSEIDSSNQLSPVQQQLKDLCSTRNLTFQFHDCHSLSSDSPSCVACLTVNDDTTAGSGKTIEAAKDQATLKMIDRLEGIPVDFGYETNHQVMDTNITTEILVKLGWNKTDSEDGLLLEEIKHKDNIQDIIEDIPEESRSFDSVPKELISEESDDGEKSITSCKITSSVIGIIAESLLNNPKRSDIVFVVGEPGEQRERVYGHSLIISLGSPVFDALLEGDWKGKEEVEIQCHPLSFMSIMRYLYTQEIIVNEDHLVETFILAMKYGLSGFLVDIISKKYLTEDFLKDNICSLLQLAHEQNCTKEIWHQAATYFDKYAEELIRKDSFLNLSVEVITSLIRRTRLSVNELSLFYSTVTWAEKRCEKEGLEVSAENLRLKMDPFIHYIRFPLMTGDEFREGPGITGILTGDECYKILCAICLGDKQDCGFSYKSRHIFTNTDTLTTSDITHVLQEENQGLTATQKTNSNVIRLFILFLILYSFFLLLVKGYNFVA